MFFRYILLSAVAHSAVRRTKSDRSLEFRNTHEGEPTSLLGEGAGTGLENGSGGKGEVGWHLAVTFLGGTYFSAAFGFYAAPHPSPTVQRCALTGLAGAISILCSLFLFTAYRQTYRIIVFGKMTTSVADNTMFLVLLRDCIGYVLIFNIPIWIISSWGQKSLARPEMTWFERKLVNGRMHLGAGIAAHTHAIYMIYGLDVRWMKILAMGFREDWLNSF